MKTKDIQQTIEFKATPHEVYETLMDTRRHTTFTQAAAAISRKVGGKIIAYDGYIEGTNIELVADEKIVQSWRASDWPANYYSQVTFQLSKTENGTKLTFTQTGVPEEEYENIDEGWKEHYWTKMKKMLEH
jgi:activator of HSP90 ATPase